jgi:dihydroorotase
MPRTMARAIVMPNLKPPVLTTTDALAYRTRILASLPPGSDFMPLMTLYLTDNTMPEEIEAAVACGHVYAVKLYPAGATTNSASGVTDFGRVGPALSRMASLGLPLLVHGEVTDPKVDIFEREPAFLTAILAGIVAAHPALKVVLEHITTKEAVAFVLAAGPNVGATITAHHLMYNRNALFEGGLHPHRYCLPVLKHESDRTALVEAATSGSPKFFLGTDSAPHAAGAKECACGAAGMFTAHAALELYAAVFDGVGRLATLPAFACTNGPAFYGLPSNAERLSGAGSTVVLRREAWTVPATYMFGGASLVPACAGETLEWKATVE